MVGPVTSTYNTARILLAMSSGCRGLVVSSLIVKTKGRHMYSERRPLHCCRFSYMATPAGLVVARVTPAQMSRVQSHAPPLRQIEIYRLVGGTTSDAICRETAAADAGAPVVGRRMGELYLLAMSFQLWVTETNDNWEIDETLYVPYSSK